MKEAPRPTPPQHRLPQMLGPNKSVKRSNAIWVVAGLILAIGLSGCAGTWTSSRPIYPDSWPALVAPDAGRTCPGLSGKYHAVSDAAAPLVYPPGGHPRNMILFVSYGEPEPVPQLGRRILSWHLAGAFPDKDDDVWSALTRYADILKAETSASDPTDEAGWVQVQELPQDLIEVSAGLRDRTVVTLMLKKEPTRIWNIWNASHVFQCKDGKLMIVGSFPPPPVENPTGSAQVAYAQFTFFRAVDGSLVMLEEQYLGPPKGTGIFKKWWRWRSIE